MKISKSREIEKAENGFENKKEERKKDFHPDGIKKKKKKKTPAASAILSLTLSRTLEARFSLWRQTFSSNLFSHLSLLFCELVVLTGFYFSLPSSVSYILSSNIYLSIYVSIYQ